MEQTEAMNGPQEAVPMSAEASLQLASADATADAGAADVRPVLVEAAPEGKASTEAGLAIKGGAPVEMPVEQDVTTPERAVDTPKELAPAAPDVQSANEAVSLNEADIKSSDQHEEASLEKQSGLADAAAAAKGKATQESAEPEEAVEEAVSKPAHGKSCRA